MYLKSIEVNGFKSFANKIDFRFEKGITGIVGPNGSGKSNVADAVRWVLGEQSASKLRGNKMEDVIFAGTESRKPMGAAYVAITLDNSDHSLPIDYSEVTVARRVYRSGESEYLINGTVSRLKDVMSMFFDTGIGKEGYSIIGQGQIERILSDKPDERRALFDEAAGIVKYKKNKQITEKQLESEHDNLNRVNDILSGLEDRVEPLRLQAEKAKTYLEYKDEQKKLDINTFLAEIDVIREKIKEIETSQEITKRDISEKQKVFEETKNEYERLENEISMVREAIDTSKFEINTKKVEIEHISGEIRVIEEKLSSEDIRKKETLEEINRLEKEKLEIEKTLEENSNKENEIKKIYESGKSKLDDIEKRRIEISEEVAKIEDKISGANSDIIEFVSKGSELREKRARYDAMLENIELRKTELKGKYLSDRSDEEKAKSDKETLESEAENLEEAEKKNEEKLSKCEAGLRESTDRISTVHSEIDNNNHEIIRLRSRLENLRNLAERYEGYGNSIRQVMEQRKTHRGVVGVVADIISVDEKYETAIETALGGSIQNIVTEDEETAKSMISYLRSNKMGRATFLPITAMFSRGGVNQDALSEKGVIGVASELVKTDPKYQKVIDSLLGRSIVVDNIDSAVMIARKYHQSLRLVTPTGELISPGGAMSGGAFRNNSNLLGRKRELEEIQAEIGKRTDVLRKAKEEETSVLMKRDSLKEEKNNISDELGRIRIDKNSIAIRLKNIKDSILTIEKDFEAIRRENRELEEQTSTININKKQLDDSGKQQESMISERKEKISGFDFDLADKKKEKETIDRKLNEAKLSLNTTEQELMFINQNKTGIKKTLEKNKEQTDNYKERLFTGDADAEVFNKEVEAKKKEIKEAEIKINELSQKLNKDSAREEKISLSHKAFFDERESCSKEISGLEKADMKLGMELEKLNEARDEKSNYMWEEYELTYSSAEALKTPGIGNDQELKKASAEVRRKIKELGEVNVGAVEEFDEVFKRYNFLKTQHDDIIEAENNLKNIIQNLDIAMKDQFSEKFKEIQTMFSKVFKELFGGGRATLSLVDENDLLETGIIINAEPPGKKLQNMIQLSGGEKSLTAISLLFAIQSLKPSPFCILDEIEAALDDSNVGRFAGYLHKLTNHTQFIVITHRKGTMEAADILYGITMQEKGISRLVSVNLIENQLTN